MSALGGVHATARRSGAAEHWRAIAGLADKGIPTTAIARMLGLYAPSVQPIVDATRPPPPPPAPPPPPPRPPVVRRPAPQARQVTLMRTGKPPYRSPEPMPPVVRQVVAAWACRKHLATADLIGFNGLAEYYTVRQAIWLELWNMRTEFGTRRYSQCQIARYFRRDSTTINTGIKKAEARLAALQSGEGA